VCAKQSRTRRFHALYDRICRSDASGRGLACSDDPTPATQHSVPQSAPWSSAARAAS
jgi:hypothetical protein